MKPQNASEIKLLRIARKANTLCMQLAKAQGAGGASLEFVEYLGDTHPGFLTLIVGMTAIAEQMGFDDGR